MRQHLNIRIFGNVQGVSFRYYAAQIATKLGISGGVKNELGGSVFIEAEGDKKTLDKFVAWCHSGSPGASVEKVDSKPGKLKTYSGFSIWF